MTSQNCVSLIYFFFVSKGIVHYMRNCSVVFSKNAARYILLSAVLLVCSLHFQRILVLFAMIIIYLNIMYLCGINAFTTDFYNVTINYSDANSRI